MKKIAGKYEEAARAVAELRSRNKLYRAFTSATKGFMNKLSMSDRRKRRMESTAKRVTRVPKDGSKPKPLTKSDINYLASPMIDAIKKMQGIASPRFGSVKVDPVAPNRWGRRQNDGITGAIVRNIKNSRNKTIERNRAAQKADKARERKFLASGFNKKSSLAQALLDKVAKCKKKPKHDGSGKGKGKPGGDRKGVKMRKNAAFEAGFNSRLEALTKEAGLSLQQLIL